MKSSQADSKPKLTVKENLKALFHHKGYSPKDYFDENVWFLENSELKSCLTQPSDNSDTTEDLVLLLKDLNIADSGLKVSVETFIQAITHYLFSTYEQYLHFNTVISSWNGEENKNLIEETSSLLSKRLTKASDTAISEITVRLSTATNFPPGPYKITLRTNKFTSTSEYAQTAYAPIILKISDSFAEFNTNDSSHLLGTIPLESRSLTENELCKVEFNGTDTKELYCEISALQGIEVKNTVLSVKKSLTALFMARMEKLLDMYSPYFTAKLDLSVGKESNTRIGLHLRLDLSDATRLEILKKVHFIITKSIEGRFTKISAVDYIAFKIFPEIGENIKFHLENQRPDPGCGCGCAVY